MKILKFITLIALLMLFSSNSFAAENKECESLLKAKTGAKMLESWKCKTENPDGEGFGKKLKNLFKKKN
tara:strand:+ start:225 stop:431 length:207 start_codon:yes stop_codon:yes gene_type:complete